ncbi:MAG: hypothetical protein IPG64_26475 [Haliea sp.]|nr:hypothetical protein [Haliea sp.]
MMFGKRILLYLGGFLIVLSANTVAAFRNCNTQDSDAWSASTRYTVGEISFDAASGLASGTETNYNYSNAHADGIGECHVTYELSGTYVPVVEVFVLNARRSNHSDTCSDALLRVEYPSDRFHNLQVEQAPDGTAVVNNAGNGDFPRLVSGRRVRSSIKPRSTARFTSGSPWTGLL